MPAIPVNRRIPPMPTYWQNFGLCLLFQMGVPLTPIGFELLFTHAIRVSSVDLTTSLYAISLGISSQSRLSFGVCIMVGVIFAALFGQRVSTELSSTTQLGTGLLGPFIVIGVLFLLHGAERYNRHVVDRAPFWEFIPREHK
jgi:hypothetical protein